MRHRGRLSGVDDGWRAEPLASVTGELNLRIQRVLAECDDDRAELLLDELFDHQERV